MKKKHLPLTETEKRVLGYILGYYSDNGYMPTLREIGIFMNYPEKSQRSSAQVITKNLEAKGRILLGKGWRNIEIKNG